MTTNPLCRGDIEVVALFDEAGFFVVDLGGLLEGGQSRQVGAPLAGHNLIRLP